MFFIKTIDRLDTNRLIKPKISINIIL